MTCLARAAQLCIGKHLAHLLLLAPDSPNSVQTLHILLFNTFLRYEAHVGPLNGLTNPLCIHCVILVGFHIGKRGKGARLNREKGPGSIS